MMTSPHKGIFLNLGDIGQDDNYVVIEPIQGGISLRFPAFDSNAHSRRQGAYVDKLKQAASALALTIEEQSEVGKNGTIDGVNFVMKINGRPHEVTQTTKSLLSQTFNVDDAELCHF